MLLLYDLKPQNPNHLVGLCHNRNFPMACDLLGEIHFMAPSAIALLAAALNIQRDLIQLFAVAAPLVVDAFV